MKTKTKNNPDVICTNCMHYKSYECPNSFYCYSTKNKPYFVERNNNNKSSFTILKYFIKIIKSWK